MILKENIMVTITIEEEKHGKNFIALDLNYPNSSNIEEAKKEALMLATVLFRLFALIGKYASGMTMKIFTDYPSEKNFCIDTHYSAQITNIDTLSCYINNIFQNLSDNYKEIKFVTVSLYLKD